MQYLFPFYEKFKNRVWGYFNENGQVVIRPQFEYASRFTEGLAGITLDERRGFIDVAGNIIINPEFDAAEPFSQERASVLVRDQWAVIDRSGSFVVPPGQFDGIDSFSEERARFWIEKDKRGHQEGFIDRSGNTAIAAKFSCVGSFNSGLAPVCAEDGKWGYVQPNGEYAIPPRFYDAKGFSEGLALVKESSASPFMFINSRAECVIPELKYDEVGCFEEGLATVLSDGGCGFINKEGRVVIPVNKRYTRVFPFMCGRACFESLLYFEGNAVPAVGFLDKHGNEAIPAQFFTASGFVHDLCWVMLTMSKAAYINVNGDIFWEMADKSC